MNHEQSTNLFGALCLAVADRQQEAARRASGLNHSATAALVTMGATPGMTIGRLARILGLTHSVAVRLIMPLELRGLISRSPGRDRREVKCQLTAKGQALRARILKARALVLDDALQMAAPGQRAVLDKVVAAMLTQLTTSRTEADHMCRLCDEDVCPLKSCPVECQAVRLESRP